MSSQPFAVRPRQKPARNVQVLSYAAGLTFILVVGFADPGHRLVLAATDALSTLAHLILN